MREYSNDQEVDRVLVVSVGGFAVFSSILFLFERLGVVAGVLIWAMCISVAAITVILAFSRSTLEVDQFFVANRLLGVGYLSLAGASGVLSATIVLLTMAGLPVGTSSVVFFVAAVIAGVALGGLLFAKSIRKSSACTIADYLHIGQNSPVLGFLSALFIAVIGILLLYAEIKLTGLYLAPELDAPFEQVTGIVLLIALIVSLLGGMAATSRVQTALLLIFLIVAVLPALWIALEIFGLPVPQMALYQSADIKLQANISGDFSREIEKFDLLWKGYPYLMMVLIASGFSTLPHILNRHLTAISANNAFKGHIRAVIIVALMLSVIPVLQFEVLFNIADPAKSAISLQIPQILRQFIPVSVLIVAISAVSLHLVMIANTLSNDVIRRLFTGKNPAGRKMFVARALIIVIAAGLWFEGGQTINAVSAFIWALIIASACLLPAMLANTLLKRAKGPAIVSGMVIGGMIVGAVFVGTETELGRQSIQTWIGVDPVLPGPAIYWIAIGAIPTIFVLIHLLSLIITPIKNKDRPAENPFS